MSRFVSGLLTLATLSAAGSAAASAAAVLGYGQIMDAAFYLSMAACAMSALAVLLQMCSRERSARKFGAPTRTVPRTARRTIAHEDFGLFKGNKEGLDYTGEWKGNPLLSEATTEKMLNEEGLRYRMNPTEEEIAMRGSRWRSIWEAIGFTATSNNKARQEVKKQASANAKKKNNEKRDAWLKKYGYPRLVGTEGIFYADQLDSDETPSGGFNMGKSGSVWGVPEVVESGQYGGEKGWGMKSEDTKATKGKSKKSGRKKAPMMSAATRMPDPSAIPAGSSASASNFFNAMGDDASVSLPYELIGGGAGLAAVGFFGLKLAGAL